MCVRDYPPRQPVRLTLSVSVGHLPLSGVNPSYKNGATDVVKTSLFPFRPRFYDIFVIFLLSSQQIIFAS